MNIRDELDAIHEGLKALSTRLRKLEEAAPKAKAKPAKPVAAPAPAPDAAAEA